MTEDRGAARNDRKDGLRGFTLGLALHGSLLLAATGIVLAAPIRVRDARGKLLSLPAPPKRIVSIAPSNTEILYALGLEGRIAAVTDYCDFPPRAKRKPKVGGVILNYEKIVSLRPDLVVAKLDFQKAAIDRLDRLGLRVFAIDPKTVRDSLSAVESIGRATGREAQAKRVTAAMTRELAKARRIVARELARPRVLAIIQRSPLIVVGPGTFLDDALRMAGARNVASGERQPYPQISPEAAVARKPEVILLSGAPPAETYRDPAWRTTPAVRNRRVYHTPFMAALERPGPRLTRAVLDLAALLHPVAAQR